MACQLWNFLGPLFGKQKPKSLKDFFYDWGVNVNLRRFSEIIAFGLASLCLWEIWKLRNIRVFEDGAARYFNNGIIFKCAAALNSCIPSKCNIDLKSRSICRVLKLPSPRLNDFKVFWCPWIPSVSGNSCSLAVHDDDNGSTICSIIRGPDGEFLCAVKIVSTKKHFLKCLIQIIHELYSLRIRFTRLQSDHDDILLLGRNAAVEWNLFQLKRKVARDLSKVDVFRVSFSLNKPAKVLCFADTGWMKTSSFSDLPLAVKRALILDGCNQPCSSLDHHVVL